MRWGGIGFPLPLHWAEVPGGAMQRWCGVWSWVEDAAHLWGGEESLPSMFPSHQTCMYPRKSYLFESIYKKINDN